MAANNPWFRLYHRIIDDEKIRLLAFEDRWHYVALCCLKATGLLDEAESDLKTRKLAVKLGLQPRDVSEVIRRLYEVALTDEYGNPLAWEELQFLRLKKNREELIPDDESLDEYKSYIYFISDESMRDVKIGYSKNPWARVRELQTAVSDKKLYVVATVKTTETSEKHIHELFTEEKKNGEWFGNSVRISRVIKEIKRKNIKTDLDLIYYVENYVATKTATTDTDTDTDTDTEKKIIKPESFKHFFAAYPVNKKGGRDVSAWKKAKSLKLAESDFEDMLVNLQQRKTLTPKWFSTYAPGICKYLDDYVWKTPIQPEISNATRQSHSSAIIEATFGNGYQ